MSTLILGQSVLGKAVFAGKEVKKGEEIIVFKGDVMKRKDLPELVKPEDDRYIQVGKDRYLGPSGEFDDFINHSCNPNSGIKIIGENVILIAIKEVKKGEEITWDYSTTMDEDQWEMDCKCGSKNCRGRIRDFKYLPEKVQRKYIKLGVVPGYIAGPEVRIVRIHGDENSRLPWEQVRIVRQSTFREKIYEIVRKIPKGETLTYKQVAVLAGRPKAYRAVGNILNKNYDPNIPCHRVIRSDKKIGGYNRGEALKQKRLKDEGFDLIKLRASL